MRFSRVTLPACSLFLRLAAPLLLLLPAATFAFEPFVIKDIRVEGIQRTEAGTVFSYLPVKVGDRFTEEQAAKAIRDLFATGFFKDVRLEVEGAFMARFSGQGEGTRLRRVRGAGLSHRSQRASVPGRTRGW